MAEIELLGIDVLLRIDGHVRSLTDVEAFFQRDPHPGGHRFFLKLEGPTAERIFPDLAMGAFSPQRRTKFAGCCLHCKSSFRGFRGKAL